MLAPAIWTVTNEEPMNEDKHQKSAPLPEFDSYIELGEFWDTHSLADYWDQTEEAQVEFSPAQRRVLVPVDPDLLMRAQKAAKARGLSTESFVNLLLEQRLQQLAAGSPVGS